MYSALLPGDILQKSSSPPTRTPPNPKPRETITTSQEPQSVCTHLVVRIAS
jgi:hypothetical protein